MKNQPGTMKNHENPLETMKNHEKPTWKHEKPWRSTWNHEKPPWKHEKPWRLASWKLNTSKRYISALTVDDRVCLEGPLSPHSCPTVDGGTCVFPFKNGIWAIFPQLITSSISGSESYSSCIEDQENRYWCSTTADVWAQCVTQKCPLGKVWTYVCHKYISASSVRFHLLTPSIEGNIVSNVLHRVCRGKSKSV